MPHLSNIENPEYTRNKNEWNKIRVIVDSGEALIDEIYQLPGENGEALKNRKLSAFDPIVIRNKIQEQLDILSLSSLDFKVENSDKLNDLFIAENGTGVDGRTQSFRNFLINDVLPVALEYKRAYVVVDRAPIIEGQSVAEAEKRSPPYAYVLNPLQVPAWIYEDQISRKLSKVITTCQDVTPEDVADNLSFNTKLCDQWTLWGNDEIFTEMQDGQQIFQKPNTLGRVPIIAFELGESLLKDVYMPVIQAVQLQSSVIKGAASIQYATLIIKTDGEIEGINADENSATVLPRDSDVDFIRPPVDGLEFSSSQIDKIRGHIDTIFKKKMFSMTAQAVQQSGVSKKADSVVQEQFSAHLANSLKDFAPQLVQLFGDYLEPGRTDYKVNTTMPDVFISRDRDGDRLDAEYLSVKYTPETEQQFITAQKEIRRLAGIENAMTADEIEADNNQILEKGKQLFAPIEVPAETFPADQGVEGEGVE